MKRSKAYRDSAMLVDPNQFYTPLEALRLAQKTSSKKADSTIDVVFKLGVDPRHADQMVRSTVILPNGTGKTARVLVFANAEKAEAALAAGADIVGGDELIEEVANGRQDFDAVVATPDLMGKVGRLGLVTVGEDQDPGGLASAVRQDDGGADHLVGVTGVDTQPEDDVDGRVGLLRGRLLREAQCLERCVELVRVDQHGRVAIRL